MNNELMRHLLPIFAGVFIGAAVRTADAEELLVFVSAFKPGDDGAIHAYRLDSDTGRLKQIHRSTDVENPFFLALSPNGKYL